MNEDNFSLIVVATMFAVAIGILVGCYYLFGMPGLIVSAVVLLIAKGI